MEPDERKKPAFDELQASLKAEAKTLLSKESIENITEEEKQKWELSELLSLPQESYIGNNLTRYTKGLVRKKQPFSFLYYFLGFMMEFSMCLLLYVILFGAWNAVTNGFSAFLSPVEFLNAGSIIFCLLLFMDGRRIYLGKLLKSSAKTDFSEKNFSKEELQTIENKCRKSSLPVLFLSILLCCIFCGVIRSFHLSKNIKIDLPVAFLTYAAFALLSGLHNVLYSSHFLPFFTIGGSMLSNRPKEQTEEALSHYKLLSYEQILDRSGKTLEEFTTDETTAKDTMQLLRNRLNTYRVYSVLGLFIVFILDIVCIRTLVASVTLTLAVFFLISLLGTVIFLTAFLSAQKTLRSLPDKKQKSPK